jgi:hypothetical protein
MSGRWIKHNADHHGQYRISWLERRYEGDYRGKIRVQDFDSLTAMDRWMDMITTDDDFIAILKTTVSLPLPHAYGVENGQPAV